MKRFLLSLIAFFLLTTACFAEYVSGYFRNDGTYVMGHFRSDQNSTVRDNFSYKNNTNPFTGETGTNYYRNNPTSEYYQQPAQPAYTPPSNYQNFTIPTIENNEPTGWEALEKSILDLNK